MAFLTKVGTITQKGSTGDQETTGIGFQPKAIIFFGNDLTADGEAVNATQFQGFSAGLNKDRAVWGGTLDAQATTNASRNNTETYSILHCLANHGTPSVKIAASIKSFDADGFTLTYATDDGGARKIGYIAFGGDDLTNASVGTIKPDGGTGNKSYTGVGFQPDFMMFISQITGNVAANLRFNNSLGMASGASNQGLVACSSDDAAATTNARNYQRTDKCIGGLNSAADTVNCEGGLTSFDADGCTINWSTGSTNWHFYLALKGGRYSVGNDTQKTSTGTQANTGPGFTPTGLFMFSFNQAATTSPSAVATRISKGAASSTSAMVSTWQGDLDNSADSVADQDLDTGAILKMMTEGTPTIQAEAHLESFDATGFTMHWSAADGTARQFVYVAFGSSPTGSESSSPSLSPSLSPSSSPSLSPSKSPSISPSLSPSSSPSISPSASYSPSSSASLSPSISPSRSPSSSVSLSPSGSPSVSPSVSPSASYSPSVSPSSSPSVSPSLSPSLSPSISPSTSPSEISSESSSTSLSPSISPSLSPSASPSISPSASYSPSSSASRSPSSSPSLSPSGSPSISPSLSPSVSPSLSPSISPSVSPSSSISASPSASPSEGYQDYTRGDYTDLPANDNDLEVIYSAQDVIDVATKDDVRVAQTAMQQTAIHQFKDHVGTYTSCTLECELQSTLAPSASTIYLQIYNRDTTTWDTVDSDNSTGADTDFILIANVADLTNYKDGNNVISCRTYQVML